VALGVAGSVLLLVVSAFHAKQQYVSLEKDNTKNIVESAKKIAEHYFRLYASGELTEVDAKQAALGVLKNIGHDNRSYVYIYHDLNFMIMHPALPEQSLPDLSPEDLIRSKAISDQQFEQHRLRYGLEEPRHSPMEILHGYQPQTKTGFFEYYFIVDDDGLGFIAELDDPHVPKNAPPKIGYGSYFEPWQWTILAGVYLGDLDEAVTTSLTRLVGMFLLVITILGFSSWVISRSISKPLAEGMDNINRILTEKNFKLPEDQKGDEVRRLGIAFYALIEQLEERDSKLRTKSIQLQNSNRELVEHKASLEKTVEERTRDYKLAKEQAEDATKAKSQFLATMTHELRTPMSGVLGIVDLLMETSLNKSQREYINIISASGKQLLDIVGDILNFEKLSANKFELESIAFDLHKLIEELVMPFQLRLKESNKLIFAIKIADNCPRYIIGDPTRVKQVINNLLSNAYKFTRQGSVSICARQQLRNGKKFLVIEVIDTGVGLTLEQQRDLFKEYQQADKSVSRNFGGTGLGLSISKKIVELMGGEIGLSSKLGAGSRFFFEFPLQIARDSTTVSQVGSEALEQAGELTQLKVLVAEDNPVNQMVIKGYLRRLEIDPVLVENGRLALDQAAANDFDVILMDINMPIMDGVEACKIIRQQEQANNKNPVAIYALTADTMRNSKSNYEAVGMNGTLAKPINFQLLVNTLNAVLATAYPMASKQQPLTQPNTLM
jgi:signal transduction histidine kinase/AmiR/NasT family two-component response regulator